jgi:hypothetical protein
MKFRLTEDWTYQTTFLGKTITKTLYTKDTLFEPNKDDKYEIIQPTGEISLFSLEDIKSIEFLEEIIEKQENDFEIIIEEIPEDDDILVRNWRIQLDVKTTRKKLKEVQRIIEEYVKPIL